MNVNTYSRITNENLGGSYILVMILQKQKFFGFFCSLFSICFYFVLLFVLLFKGSDKSDTKPVQIKESYIPRY